jgi:amidase
VKEYGMRDDLGHRSATALSALLAAGEVSSAELVQAAIARIELMDGPINALVCRRFEAALRDARHADAARSRGEAGPLLGIPLTIKESFNLVDLPTTRGNPEFRGWCPAEDVARLRAAGAALLGKTNVPVMLDDWQSPTGRSDNGLPIGVQAIGPFLEDRTTMAFAGFIEREFGSFAPPSTVDLAYRM